jgi:hypothetical protein
LPAKQRDKTGSVAMYTKSGLDLRGELKNKVEEEECVVKIDIRYNKLNCAPINPSLAGRTF